MDLDGAVQMALKILCAEGLDKSSSDESLDSDQPMEGAMPHRVRRARRHKATQGASQNLPRTEQHELIISDFCQSFLPAQTEASRHWLVDHPIGRELLATALRMTRPDLKLPMMVGRDPQFDVGLNDMVPALGLENLAEPKTPWQDIKISWSLMRRTAVLEFTELRRAFTSIGNKGKHAC